jgi:hypothetical protein
MMTLPYFHCRKIQILGIVVIVLGGYLCALQAGFLAVDDVDTIKHIQSGKIVVTDLFTRGGEYYRPLALLSLLTDFYLYGGNPVGYHLTSILLHLANALLVYALASALLRERQADGFYPFLAALLFAVHPVNTEAVIWISARPDVLCCFFSLLCLLVVTGAARKVSPAYFPAVFLSFLCALMAKEASLFLPLLIASWLWMERKTVGVRNGVATLGALLAAAGVYFVLRKGLPAVFGPSVTPGGGSGGHPLSCILDGAAAYGFYIRKLFYPFPLNIAITEINTTFGIAIFVFSSVVAALGWLKEKTLRFPLAFLGLSLLPPLGAVFFAIPWTPFAERYLYLPSVALALCAAVVFQRFLAGVPRPALVICMLVLLIPTVSRARMWTRPIPFWEDAAEKSPGFGTVRLVLAAEYLQAGRCLDAEQAFRLANQSGLPRKTARDFADMLRGLLENRCSSSLKGRELPSSATEQSIPWRSTEP